MGFLEYPIGVFPTLKVTYLNRDFSCLISKLSNNVLLIP